MKGCKLCINLGRNNFCYINSKYITNDYEAEFCNEYLAEENMLDDKELRCELSIIKKIDNIIENENTNIQSLDRLKSNKSFSKNIELNKSKKNSCEECTEFLFGFYCKKLKKSVENIFNENECNSLKSKIYKNNIQNVINSNKENNINLYENNNKNLCKAKLKFSSLDIVKDLQKIIINRLEFLYGVLADEYKKYILELNIFEDISNFIIKLDNIENIDSFFCSIGINNKSELTSKVTLIHQNSVNIEINKKSNWIVLNQNQDCENLKFYIQSKKYILSKSQIIVANFIVKNIYEIINYKTAKELADFIGVSSSTISSTLTRLRLGNLNSLINQIRGYYQ